MIKIDETTKHKIIAGFRTKKLPLFSKIMGVSMFGESVSGLLNLVNQVIYYNKTGNYKNQPNHYYNSSARFYYKIAPYPSGSSMNMGPGWI